MYGAILLSILIDLLFLLLWVGIHDASRAAFDWLERPHGLDGLTLTVVEILFNIATLGVIGAYVAWDLIQSVRRIWEMR